MVLTFFLVFQVHRWHRYGGVPQEYEIFCIFSPRMRCGSQVLQCTGWIAGCVERVSLPGPYYFFQSNEFHSLKFTDVFAFGAERLIARQVQVWIMSYADQVIVSGQPSSSSIGNLLYSSNIGKHTSVIYINKLAGEPSVTLQYIWEHSAQRPNTHSYPLACPSCRYFSSWRNVTSHAGAAEGSAFELTCKAKVGGVKCNHVWRVPKRPSSTAIGSPYVGVWRKIE